MYIYHCWLKFTGKRGKEDVEKNAVFAFFFFAKNKLLDDSICRGGGESFLFFWIYSSSHCCFLIAGITDVGVSACWGPIELWQLIFFRESCSHPLLSQSWPLIYSITLSKKKVFLRGPFCATFLEIEFSSKIMAFFVVKITTVTHLSLLYLFYKRKESW